MRLFMSREVVRVATRKSRVLILRIDLKKILFEARTNYAWFRYVSSVFYSLRGFLPRFPRDRSGPGVDARNELRVLQVRIHPGGGIKKPGAQQLRCFRRIAFILLEVVD